LTKEGTGKRGGRRRRTSAGATVSQKIKEAKVSRGWASAKKIEHPKVGSV